MKSILTKVKSINEVRSALDASPVVILERGKREISEIQEIASSVEGSIENGIFGKIRDLKVEKTLNNSVGSSSEPHPPHTDGCYIENPPPYIILQCVEPDLKNGGIGLFWDLGSLLEHMPEKYKRALIETPMTYARKREDGVTVDQHQGFILQEEYSPYGQLAIRWRYDERLRPAPDPGLSKQEVKLFQDAVTHVINFFQTGPTLRVPYHQGDIVIASNRCLTHGRTRILDHRRLFRRAWLRPIAYAS